MICTIYSHLLAFDKIQATIVSLFPNEKLRIKQQDELELVELAVNAAVEIAQQPKLKIIYRQRPQPSYKLPEINDSALTSNLKGMYAFVASLPAENALVKELLLQKIPTLNCEFSIAQGQGELAAIAVLIQRLAAELDAIVFVEPNTLISKSDSQHFLDKNLNLIIDAQGKCEINHLAVNINANYFTGTKLGLSQEQQQRKVKSEAIIKAKNIKLNPYLPCIEAEAQTLLRPPAAIAKRVTLLALTNLVAFNKLSATAAIEYLKKYNLWQEASPNERYFLTKPTENQKNIETWKAECIWILLWALYKVDQLCFPDKLCDLSQIASPYYPIGPDKNPHDFIASIATTRSKAEILDACDLYYRLDWACVEARIQGQAMQQLHPGVVYERHYALNWLVNYMEQDWDNISCDT